MKKFVLLMIAAIIILSTAANAEVINVNMYASNGGYQLPEDPATLEGPAGGLGETWNQFNTTTGSGLLDSNGALTSVGFSNNVGSGWGQNSTAIELTALKSSRASFGKGADTAMTITGLEAGGLYNIWIASYNRNSLDAERALGEWSTSNSTTTVGPQMIDGRGGYYGTTWEYGVNYVMFENVVANASGEIVLLGDAADGTVDVPEYGETFPTRLHLNCFQIKPSVPEPMTDVPDVVGLSQANAESDLTAASLVAVVSTEYSNIVPAGVVISQNPAGGTSVSEGSLVALVVSLGQAPMTDVPDVVGLSQANAESDITAASLVAVVSTDYSSTVAAGDVISQNPEGGTSVFEGSSVDILVSLGEVTAANARVINVNFYASSGGDQNPEDASTLAGPAGGLGEFWNQYNITSATGLLDSTGAATTIGFSNNVSSGWATNGLELTMLNGSRAHFGKGTDTTHTINGLTAGNMYHVWIASYNESSSVVERARGEWSTSNSTTTVGPQMIDERAGLNSDTWEYGVNYVLFENVEADTNGEITFLGDAFDGTDGIGATRLHMNGFQIEEVDMTAPFALAGSDWITWYGKPVTLNDVTVENNDPGAGALTLTWSYEPVSSVTVGFSDTNVKEPTVTITKDPLTGGVTPVTLTLTVDQPGKETVSSSMRIDVYDDACKAALGAGTTIIGPSDFNADCVTGLEDVLRMASAWLVDFSLTGPVDK